MSRGLYILAADDGNNYVEIIIFVAVVAFTLIAGAIQKALKKKQEEDRRQGARRTPGGPAEARAQGQGRHQAAEELRHAARAAFGLEVVAKPPPAPPTEPAAAEAERARSGRKTPPLPKAQKPAEPKSIVAGLKRAKPEAGEAAAAGKMLKNIDELRRAIVYREILSPPKGLRRGPEMWDI